MGRYRAPVPPGSPYITRQGYQTLQDELQQIWVRRAEVTRALSAAAAEGDRSENAEYQYRKKELRGIDRRIRYLQKRLPVLNVVADPPANTKKVYFGAWVELAAEGGRDSRLRIVGADEFDAAKNWISMDSPVAKALLGKQLDDEVQVHTPAGPVQYTILGIEYELAPGSGP